MSLLRKIFLNKCHLLTLLLCVNAVNAAQVSSGGLAAARAKAKTVAQERGQQKQIPQSSRAPRNKRPLSPELEKKLQEEQEKIKKPVIKETQPLGDIKPVAAETQELEVVEPAKPARAEIPSVVEEGDRYVQSEAHLQLEEVQHRMADFLQQPIGFIPKEGQIIPPVKTPNEMVTPYLHIVGKAIDREVEFKNSHYVFYHGMSNAWRVVQDLYTQLYAYYNPLKPVKDFTFVRFTDMPSIKAQDYLSEAIATHAGVNDNILEVRTLLLPVNLALFGNVGFPGECTWNYFLSPKSHLIPLPDQNLQPILDAFTLSYDLQLLVKEIEELTEMLVKASPEQTLLQIFIPQEKADDVAYLAWIIGFPAHPKSMDLVESIVEDRPKVGGITGPAVKHVMKMYKAEGEDNPLYKELIEAVENGDFGVDAFLKVYRNNPSELKHVNDTQARLVITNDVLLNPQSGVKFFSYFTTPKEIQDSYLKKLNALVRKIVAANKKKKI